MRNYCIIAIAILALQSCVKNSQPSSSTDNRKATTELTASAVAANVTVAYTDESSFVNSLSSYGFKTPDQLSLNRTASSGGYTSVYGFNIPAANQVKGFKWNSGDETTTDWRPQGIAGFQLNGRNFLLVTWYGVGPDDIAGVYNQQKGVRISLVDITRKVLLHGWFVIMMALLQVHVIAGRMEQKTCTMNPVRVIYGILQNMKHRNMVAITGVCLQ